MLLYYIVHENYRMKDTLSEFKKKKRDTLSTQLELINSLNNGIFKLLEYMYVN